MTLLSTVCKGNEDFEFKKRGEDDKSIEDNKSEGLQVAVLGLVLHLPMPWRPLGLYNKISSELVY